MGVSLAYLTARPRWVVAGKIRSTVTDSSPGHNVQSGLRLTRREVKNYNWIEAGQSAQGFKATRGVQGASARALSIAGWELNRSQGEMRIWEEVKQWSTSVSQVQVEELQRVT